MSHPMIVFIASLTCDLLLLVPYICITSAIGVTLKAELKSAFREALTEVAEETKEKTIVISQTSLRTAKLLMNRIGVSATEDRRQKLSTYRSGV